MRLDTTPLDTNPDDTMPSQQNTITSRRNHDTTQSCHNTITTIGHHHNTTPIKKIYIIILWHNATTTLESFLIETHPLCLIVRLYAIRYPSPPPYPIPQTPSSRTWVPQSRLAFDHHKNSAPLMKSKLTTASLPCDNQESFLYQPTLYPWYTTALNTLINTKKRLKEYIFRFFICHLDKHFLTF